MPVDAAVGLAPGLQVDPGDQLGATLREGAEKVLEQPPLVQGMGLTAAPVALVDPDVVPLWARLRPPEGSLRPGHRRPGDPAGNGLAVAVGHYHRRAERRT